MGHYFSDTQYIKKVYFILQYIEADIQVSNTPTAGPAQFHPLRHLLVLGREDPGVWHNNRGNTAV